MITFHNVDKRYRIRNGYKVVLNHLSLQLPTRNIGILGGNGAGKSTLLRMISGAEKPTSGRVECHRRVSFPLGFAGSFNISLSGMENALFVSRIYGVDTEGVIEYVKEFSQLGDQLYMPVSSYSSGMRARLAFGVSLAIDFELYLVDELTAVGDASFRERSREAFKAKLGHATIIMVSHSMSTLRQYCDAGVVLHDGELTYFDSLEDAIQEHERHVVEAGGTVTLDPKARQKERQLAAQQKREQRRLDAEQRRAEARKAAEQNRAGQRRGKPATARDPGPESRQEPGAPPPLPLK